MQIDKYLEELPKLHSWDSGATWNTGGFHKEHLLLLNYYANTMTNARVIETGAGNSTITFLLSNIDEIVSIAPDNELFRRIFDFCEKNDIKMHKLKEIISRSEDILPSLARENCKFNLALIDGAHGWPHTFIDFFYINTMLEKDSVLILDDLQLHSVKELAKWLNKETNTYKLEHTLNKMAVFRKLDESTNFSDWDKQEYIVTKSQSYEMENDKFSIDAYD